MGRDPSYRKQHAQTPGAEAADGDAKPRICKLPRRPDLRTQPWGLLLPHLALQLPASPIVIHSTGHPPPTTHKVAQISQPDQGWEEAPSTLAVPAPAQSLPSSGPTLPCPNSWSSEPTYIIKWVLLYVPEVGEVSFSARDNWNVG